MKKIFTCILAICFAVPMFSKIIWTENFNYNVGDLTTKTTQDDLIGTDYANWYYTQSGSYTLLQVADTNLTYPNYCTNASGKAIKIAARGYKTGRQFAKIESGSVFVSALIKINTLQSSDGTKEYFMYMTPDISSSNAFARLHTKKDADGYYLGIAKFAESNSYLRYSQKLNYGETYLVIMQYDFADGDKNDFVSLYINPTSETAKPTVTCVRDTTTGSGTAQGSDSKNDAASIAGIMINQTAYTSRNMFIDEIKVFTSWSDISGSLPTGSDDPVEPTPTLSVTKSAIDFGKFIKGGIYEQTFKVTAENLKDDITITCDNTNAVLVSPTTIAKDNADLAGDGVEVTASINPERQVTFSGVKITVASTDAESKVITAKGTEQVITYKDVASFASLLEEAETDDVIYTYTGTEAKILSVDEEYKQITLKDASNKSVKVQLSDAQWETINPVNGMKVASFVFTAEILLGGTHAICTPITLTFAVPNFTREITSTDLATICLKGDVSNFAKLQEQATFYKILYKQEYNGEVYNIVLEEVNTNMEAGKPYIFQPKEPCTMEFYYSATTDFAGSENGLIGTFTNIESAVDNILVGKYLISNNMFCKAGEYCSLAANRAYIDIDQVPAEENATQKVGLRHINLQNADARQLPTNLNEIKAHNSVRKAIVNGRFVIINNNKAFNAIGAEIQ